MQHSISVIIPSKNDGKSLRKVLQGCKGYYDELFVVDAHSTDHTVQVARLMGAEVLFDNGRGKGAALRLSVAQACCDIVVFIDADGSHITEDIPKLVGPIKAGTADLVIASRVLGGSAELSGTVENNLRRFFSWSINLIINARFRSHITDAQNGFRAIRRDIFLDLELEENIFSIEQEMVIKCLKKNYRILEVPSFERAREYGVSHLSLWRHGPRYFWCVLKNIW